MRVFSIGLRRRFLLLFDIFLPEDIAFTPEDFPRQGQIHRAAWFGRGDAESLLEDIIDIFISAELVVPLDEVAHHRPLVERLTAPVGALGRPLSSP